MIHILPADPVEQMQVQLRHALGLYRSLCSTAIYLWQLAHGDFGNLANFKGHFERYPATLQLAFLALVVSAAFAIPF